MSIKFSVVIQAGGKSTRMSQDKGLVPFMGAPLTQYVLQQIDGLGDESIIISNRPESYKQFGLPIFEDIYKDVGALGGLYSAIYHASHEYCLVLACDMPFINRALLKYLLDLAPEHDAAIPRLNPKEFIEPFRAVYKKTCLEPIRNAIEGGQRRVISFFDQVDIRFVERAEVEKYDPGLKSFFNINTSEDLAEAERIANDQPSPEDN